MTTTKAAKGAVKGKGGARTAAQAKGAKKAQFLASLASAPLLGQIVMWGGGAAPYKEVVQALKSSGLDETTAKELRPRDAFSRACKTLQEERVIDYLKEDGNSITFQLTKKALKEDAVTGKMMEYNRETHIHLDRTTGNISCPVPEVREAAQAELNRCLEHRGANDITRIIHRLFDKNADLFPVGDRGGVFFVPREHGDFILKISSFLERVGGRLTPFPVPAGVGDADRSVQTAVAQGISDVIRDHEEAVAGFGLGTRADTLEAEAGRIRETRAKVEAYAHYLNEERERLLAEADAAAGRLAARVEELSKQRESLPPDASKGGRAYIFGHPVTAVIRWMGQNGLGFAQARRVLNHYGCEANSDATIRTQLQVGRSRAKDPAPLTAEQGKELKAIGEGGAS